jgi:hypothetical protein
LQIPEKAASAETSMMLVISSSAAISGLVKS